MPRYRVENSGKNSAYVLDAPDAQSACDLLGWQTNLCSIWIMSETEMFSQDPILHPVQVESLHLDLNDPMNQKILDHFLALDHVLAIDIQHSSFSEEEDLSFLWDHGCGD
jgi:hypothetical protein